MPELELASRDRAIVVGKTGAGKSYFVKQLATEAMSSNRRWVSFDVCDEMSGEGRESQETELGPLTQRCTPQELYRDPRKFLDRADLALAVVPNGEPEQVAKHFKRVAELVRDTGNVIFHVSEVGYFQQYAQGALNQAATLYRKDSVAMVFDAQRAVQVPLTARSQASLIFAFNQDTPEDLQALSERCGRDVPDLADRLPRLAVGECIPWRDSLSSKGRKK